MQVSNVRPSTDGETECRDVCKAAADVLFEGSSNAAVFPSSTVSQLRYSELECEAPFDLILNIRTGYHRLANPIR